MPTMQDSLVVAAGAVSANVLAGQMWEFVPNGANVVLATTGSAIGLRTSFTANVPLVQDQAIGLQNRFPLVPDDIMFSGIVAQARLLLSFRNTTGGNLTAFWRVDVN